MCEKNTCRRPYKKKIALCTNIVQIFDHFVSGSVMRMAESATYDERAPDGDIVPWQIAPFGKQML